MSQNHETASVRLLAPRVGGDESVLTPEALRFLSGLGRKFADRVPALLARRRAVQERLDAGERFDFLPETRDVREGDWTVAPLPGDLLDRRVEITGPVDRKMIINALNSGANVFMADFEDATSPDLGEPHRGPGEPARRGRGAISVTTTPRRASATRSTTRPATLIVRPRGWHLAEKHVVRRRRAAARRRSSTSGSSSSTTRARSSRRGTGPVLLPAEDGEPPRGAPVERRLRVRAGARSACRTARSRRRCSSRRCPRRSRWTRSSTSCASTRPASTAAAGTTSSASSRSSGHDPACVLPDRAQVTMDAAVPARLHAAAREDLPPPRRPRDGRHGGADPDQERPGGERGGAREGARRQAARGEGRPRRHLGRAPGPRAARARGLRRAHARRRTRSSAKREDVRVTRGRPARASRRARAPRPGLRHNIRVGVQYLEAWLARPRLRAALQPDGRRGDRGDLPRAGLAVDPPRGDARRRRSRSPRSASARRVDDEMAALRERARPSALRRRPLRRGARAVRAAVDRASTFEEFLTLPAYELLISAPRAALVTPERASFDVDTAAAAAPNPDALGARHVRAFR